MSRRSFLTSSLASLILRQTEVPTSTTDWCISAFTRSCKQQLALFDDFRVDVRAQIARDRIDGLILLFDPDRESRMHGCPSGGMLAAGVVSAAFLKRGSV